MALYVLTAVGRIHQLFPIIELVHPAILGGALALVMYAADGQAIRRLHHVWLRPLAILLLLFAWMVLGIATALVISNSFDLVVNNFAKTVAMSIVIAGCIRGGRDVERLMLVYLAAAAIYAAVAIERFDLGTGANWRLGHLYYYDANDLATFLVTAMPFGLYFVNSGRRLACRAAVVGALVVITVAFVRTGSRGGFLALGAVALFVVLRYTAVSLRKRIAVTAIIVVAIGVTASGRYWNQMATITEDNDYNRTEQTGRLHIWQRGIGYMLHHPLLGVGANNFQTAEGTISPLAIRQEFGVGVTWNAAHNSYVQTGAELGVPGLFLFVGVIWTSLAMLRRAGQRAVVVSIADRMRRELTQALTASLIGFAVGAFFLSLAYHEILYTLVAFAVGLVKTAPSEQALMRRRW